MKAHYRKGYKYQLTQNLAVQTDILPIKPIITPRIELDCTGYLLVREGYASDGVSGPVIDRRTNLRGGFIHDALYQLMRMELLPHYYWRDADREFAKALRQDGAWAFTIKVDLLGLRIACGAAALPKNRKRVYSAP